MCLDHLFRALSCAALLVGCDDDPAIRAVSQVERVTVGVPEQTTVVPSDGDGPDATDADDADGAHEPPIDTAQAPPDAAVETEVETADAGPDLPDVEPDSEPGPEVTPALHPARYPAGRVHSPLTPYVVERLQQIRAVDPALQDDVFMKVGASTTVSASFFKCFAGASVDLGAHAHLQSTLDFFLDGDAAGGDPFSRTTLAAKSGVSARWAIDGDPSPLESEYLAIAPRYALVHYGTNDMGLGTTYESALWGFGENLWTLVDDLLSWGVVPVLATISRRLDSTAADRWVSTYNGVITALAEGRQIPLVDLNLAYEPLPNHGVSGDGVHGTVYPGGACRLTDEGLAFGLNTRNLEMLTALSRLEAAVLDEEALDPPGPAPRGLGTIDDPRIIDALPFHDLRSTRDALQSELDIYTGCASTVDESGPEVIYRLDVTAPVRVRATVHDLGSVDIDLHLLDETGSAEGCLARAHRIVEATLQPGRYHFALDTFVSASGVNSGEYLLSIIACPSDDPSCG